MTWWAWILLWTVLSLFSLIMFALIGRSLWRKALALGAEIGAAAERVSGALGGLGPPGEGVVATPELAIFDSPAVLRQTRATVTRQHARHRALRQRS